MRHEGASRCLGMSLWNPDEVLKREQAASLRALEQPLEFDRSFRRTPANVDVESPQSVSWKVFYRHSCRIGMGWHEPKSVLVVDLTAAHPSAAALVLQEGLGALRCRPFRTAP